MKDSHRNQDLNDLRIGSAILLAVALVFLTVGQGVAQTTVTGRVVNETGEAFPDALVRVGTTNRWLITDANGHFSLSGVPEGEHRLTISHPGTEPRGFALQVPADQPFIDLGTLQLSSGEVGVRRIQGTISDAAGGDPMSTVVVRVFRQVALTTDSSGTYVLDVAPLDGDSSVPLTFARLGYTRNDTTIFLGADPSTTFDFQLQPSPLTLAGILVEEIGGAATSPRISGFFDRRRQGFGDFFTAEEIKKIGYPVVSDVVRRVPGVSVLSAENVNAFGSTYWADRVLLSFGRAGSRAGQELCEPAIFIDDVWVRPRNIDVMMSSDRIAAMEVYQTATSVPVMYRGPGSECGALVIWTKLMTAEDASPFEIGFGFGGFGENRSIGRDWTGGYFAIPLHTRIDLYPAFQLLRGNLSGYRFRLAARYKVLMSGRIGLHIGPGLYFENGGVGGGLERFTGVLVGVPVRFRSVRFTAEAQWIDLANTTRLDLGFHFGVAILSGGF